MMVIVVGVREPVLFVERRWGRVAFTSEKTEAVVKEGVAKFSAFVGKVSMDLPFASIPQTSFICGFCAFII